MFHSIVNGYSYCKLTSYFTFFEGSNLRSCHLDKLCLTSSLKPKSFFNHSTETNHGLNNAYFYRSHLLWNKVPLEIREIKSSNRFRCEITKWIWNSEIMATINNDFDSDENLSDSDFG